MRWRPIGASRGFLGSRSPGAWGSRKGGLSGQCIPWVLGEPHGIGMTAQLGAAELMRLRRAGVRPFSVDKGLALLDAALARAEGGLVAAPFDLGLLQRQAEQAMVPALLRTLVRPPHRRPPARTDDSRSWRE